ncbi:hypothetical protein SteCoe_22823 [Stentor coeruleus]|uniref:Uncharacterized protein n=1 Tax=Stentor coeruleus TaxID=5963 RepID=A0A1R2BLZ8_9CILI|nr:hypothetical protein SteCoe_22823 [Stentor coeruleus]
MNKSNPYRIISITESVYDKIILSRENPQELKIESPKNPKAIYLPPVRCEDNVIGIMSKANPMRVEFGKEPFSLNSTRADIKIDNFQVLSKSLDFEDMISRRKQDDFCYTKKKYRQNIDDKNIKGKQHKKNSDSQEYYIRTMSAMQNRDDILKLPIKFRENKSPWAFQAQKFFNITLKNN